MEIHDALPPFHPDAKQVRTGLNKVWPIALLRICRA